MIRKFVRTEIIVAVHLSLKGRNEIRSEIVKNMRSYFPSAVIFDKELQSKDF